MTKSIYILLIALVVLSSANPIDKVKDIFKNDKCVVDELNAIRPRIEQNINTLKAVIVVLFRTKMILLLKLH
jgi:hypothetical protein